MRISTFLGASALSATLPLLASADHGHHNARQHHHISRRDPYATALEKRGLFTNTRFTYYDITAGQVACEGWHKASEFVVALNAHQYGTYWKSQYCGKQVTINYGGKTATATIVDECMGCPYGGLDFTEGLFKYFADESLGVIYGQWSFLEEIEQAAEDAIGVAAAPLGKYVATSSQKSSQKNITPKKTAPKATPTPSPSPTQKKNTSAVTKPATAAPASGGQGGTAVDANLAVNGTANTSTKGTISTGSAKKCRPAAMRKPSTSYT